MVDHQENNKNIEEADIDLENEAVYSEDSDVEEIDEPAEENDAEVLALQKELKEAESQIEEYKDGWQRSRAEFTNYKKRVDRERAQMYKNAKGDVIKTYLDITDDLQRALENPPLSEDGVRWAEGIELVYRKLLAKLENEGVTVMETDDQLFDPTLHEAVTLDESPDHESGEIIEVLSPGYMLGDRVLRPATVRVAS